MKEEVLIVGASASGMTLALQLHRYGVPLRIIETDRHKATPASALGLTPDVLQLFDDLGLGESLVACGHPLQAIHSRTDANRQSLTRYDLRPHRHPFVLMLAQLETERLLEARLNALGHVIERDCELLGLEPEADRVRVRLRRGTHQTLRSFAYVAGCDSGRDRLRTALGLGAGERNARQRILLADLPVQWAGSLSEGHCFIRDQDFLALLPLGNGQHRILVKSAAPYPSGQAPSLQELRASIARQRIQGLEIEAPTWRTSLSLRTHGLPMMRRGRVFIGAEATHLHDAIGGFGLNGAIAEAFSLGWKLGYRLNGGGNDGLLDPPAATQAPPLAADAASRPDLAPPLLAGHPPPYVADTGAGGDSLALLGHGRHSLLLVPPRDEPGMRAALQLLARVQHASLGLVRTYLLTDTRHAGRALPPKRCHYDEQQRLRQAYGLAEGDFVLIRPDFQIASLGRLPHCEELWNELQHLHGFDTALLPPTGRPSIACDTRNPPAPARTRKEAFHHEAPLPAPRRWPTAVPGQPGQWPDPGVLS